VEKICPRTKISCIRGKIKDSEIVFRLIVFEKKIDSPRKQYTSFPSVTEFVTCSAFTRSVKFPPLFQLDPGAQQISRMFITFSF